MTRKVLLENCLAVRLALDAGERRAKEEKLFLLLTSSPLYEKAKTIALYMPIRGELSLTRFPIVAKKDGKILLLPRIEKKGKMTFRPYSGEEELVLSEKNILEPSKEERIWDRKIDLMLIPCVGYHGCYRLGYGGNFYNNYLRENEVGFTLGIALKKTGIEEDFHGEKDIPLDRILAL